MPRNVLHIEEDSSPFVGLLGHQTVNLLVVTITRYLVESCGERLEQGGPIPSRRPHGILQLFEDGIPTLDLPTTSREGTQEKTE